MENIIEFKNVRKAYGPTRVLRDLSFEIKKNRYVALIGNNGCGKTTTINILCNLLNFDGGEIAIFDKKLTRDYVSYKSKFGILLSKPYYIEDFTVAQHLEFVGRFQNIPSNIIGKRIDDVLKLVDLQANRSKTIADLSSGNQMKVSLASALIHAPDVLVLDEPFVNLDIEAIDNVMHILESIRSSKTLFITSHNLDLVANLCDTFLIMNKGEIATTLQRSEFSSVEDLKEKVKDMLVSDRQNQKELSWLTNSEI